MKDVSRCVFAWRKVCTVRRFHVHQPLDWKLWIHIAWNGRRNQLLSVQLSPNAVQVISDPKIPRKIE